ncbi:MCM DNA helicase complex subunit, partial [Coemansia spiralis]
YNTLPETPMPFSPPPIIPGRGQRAEGGAAARGGGVPAAASSSPQLGFSDLLSTPGPGGAIGGMAMAYSEALSSQLGSLNMGSQRAGRRYRGDVGFQGQALSSELGDQAAAGAQPVEVRTIWGTLVQVREVLSTFRDFLQHFTAAHRPPSKHTMSDSELHEPVYPALIRRMHDTEIYQLNVDARNISAYPPAETLYRQIVNYPSEVMPILDHVLTEMYMQQFPDANVELAQEDLKVRVYNLHASTNMRDLNPSDIDRLVSVRGMMIRASSVIPDMKLAFFRCLQCDWTTTVGIDKGVISEPRQCGNPACLQKDVIELVHNRSVFVDKQLARLQETPEVIPDGQTPHTVTLVVHDELVDACKPGDRLEITG